MSRPLKGSDELELSVLQAQFVEEFFENNESPTRIAKAMGWPDRGRVSSMLRSQRVKIAIAKRKQQIQLFKAGSDEFNISKADKQRVLWDIAQTGAKQGYDKVGNTVMLNPASSIAAIREMNLMDGMHKPTQIEVAAIVDNRSEDEIKANIIRLMNEFKNLPDQEGVPPSFDLIP